ncbi:MAG: recombinase family protein [Oscillospiraceae bacterium]|nr:recombinase family protein [Oscillospiraceae bacterium]
MKTEKIAPAARAALYVRVSTEEQAVHGLSIEAQREALDAWAEENRICVTGHYIDAGISARKPASKRPELQRLLEDVRNGRIDLIVFTKLDRWFRNIAEYYKVQEVLEKHHVNWKTIHEDYDTSTASGRLKVNIMLSVAQDEADRTSERIKAVFDGKKERKEPCTGKVPTGYRIEGKRIVKDPEMEEAVACFFESFLASRSIEKARRATEARCGVLFTYYLSRLMLGKEAYYGRFGGVDGMCPAYITREQHEEILANRRRAERKTDSDRVYLFAGIVYCSECGRRYGSHTNVYKVKSGQWRDGIAYNCRGRYNNGDCGNKVNILERTIEEYLLQNVDEELRRFVCDLEQAASEERPAVNYPEERAKIKKKLARLKDLYVDAIIDLELYRKDYEALTARLDALTLEERRAPAHAPRPDRLLSIFTGGWQDAYVRLERPERQEFWRMTLDRILVHPTRQLTVFFRP